MSRGCAAFVLAFALVGCANRAKQSIALYEKGDYAGAATAADRGLADHPDDDGLWQMRIRSALAQGDADGVAKAYASYHARRNGDDPELLRSVATATLGQALKSPSPKLKMIAIDAVADAEIHELADDVAARMEDEDERVVASAAVAVLRGFPDAPRFAKAMLSAESPDARRIAVDGIGRKVGRLAITDIERAADDSDPRVRRAAIRWLGQLNDGDALPILDKHMKDPDDGVRAAAATALAHIAKSDLVAAGKQALADKALAVRLAGIELLVVAHREDDVVAFVDDPDPMLALHASIAVHAKHPDAAGKALERAITAEDWATRAGAANLAVRAIGKVGANVIAHRLVADKELAVRLAAARVLAHGGDKQAAADVFASALDDLEAVTDLADLKDPRGVTALEQLVRDPRRTPDQRAAAAAAHRGAHRITPGLVAALADPSGLVRVQAAATLAALAK
jgi:HEAT repeat protein